MLKEVAVDKINVSTFYHYQPGIVKEAVSPEGLAAILLSALTSSVPLSGAHTVVSQVGGSSAILGPLRTGLRGNHSDPGPIIAKAYLSWVLIEVSSITGTMNVDKSEWQG